MLSYFELFKKVLEQKISFREMGQKVCVKSDCVNKRRVQD